MAVAAGRGAGARAGAAVPVCGPGRADAPPIDAAAAAVSCRGEKRPRGFKERPRGFK